jgi:uncharacterized membrane protein
MATFFVIGGMSISRLFRVRHVYAALLVILAVYFLCTSGVTYQMFGYPRSLVLNSTGEYYDKFFVHDQDSRAAAWLGEHDDERSVIYTERGGIMLISQGMIPQPRLGISPIELYLKDRPISGYVFLRYNSVVNDKITGDQDKEYRLSDFPGFLKENSKIYVSNGAAIYQ